MNIRLRLIPILLMIALMTACESNNERVARLATENAERQAEQNRDMAKLTQDAIENHRRVVEAAENSQQAMLSLEKDLQDQRNRLDDERQAIADERRRESLLAPVASTIGVMLVCSLPLILCWYLLSGLRNSIDDETSELLLSELIDNDQMLLPRSVHPPAIEQSSSRELSTDTESPG